MVGLSSCVNVSDDKYKATIISTGDVVEVTDCTHIDRKVGDTITITTVDKKDHKWFACLKRVQEHDTAADDGHIRSYYTAVVENQELAEGVSKVPASVEVEDLKPNQVQGSFFTAKLSNNALVSVLRPRNGIKLNDGDSVCIYILPYAQFFQMDNTGRMYEGAIDDSIKYCIATIYRQ